MAAISRRLNRRVGLLIDRAGRIEAVAVGEAHRLTVPRQPSAPSGRLRFCTLRFIATQLDDDDPSAADLASIALHRLDAMAWVAVDDGGQPGPVRVAHLLPAPARARHNGGGERRVSGGEPLPRGFARPRPARSPRKARRVSQDIEADGERYRLWPPRPAARIDEDFLDLIRALEEEFDRHLPRVKRAGQVGRAILVHVTTGPRADAEASIDELAELAASADLEVVERVVQRRAAFDPKTLMGSGKLQDLIIHALRLQADFIVVDQDLTPAQARAIAVATDLKVIDRTQLILDIFADRARTHEGKIQVELAQLNYLLPRLAKRGDSGLSRLEGGIGGRGPGEQKLEIDRRRVRERIRGLERQLLAERKRREQRRSRRRQRDVPVISLVGYTNAGKSTLLNLLTRSDVFVEHRMFATLDPTSRRLRLPREREVIINDTVGFIRDLPRDLIAAFRATLEEIEDSDLIVHLVDISHPDHEAQIEAVRRILEELDYDDIPHLLVFNKADRLDAQELAERVNGRDGVVVSALRGAGIDALLEQIDCALPRSAQVEAR
ncbi:MAG TPA: GTPase HflX [Candidatus Polarisedimenticolaceae bacterium]|nr:GTPase HflX [Candidatus Polarisedimenticolaceae bacterium]